MGRKIERKSVRIGIALIVGILFFMISEMTLMGYFENQSINEHIVVAEKYLTIQQSVEYMMMDNVNLIKGLGAYIQMNDTYTDDEIQEILRILYDDRLDEVRNVGVIEDTTVRWVFPLKGNEAIIGVDLAAIPEQVKGILKVKNNLETGIYGPIDLVQGGKGFIVRIPIKKNDVYWGMGSVVLNADHAFQFLSDFETAHHVKILLTHTGNPSEVIYGDPAILEQQPMRFGADTNAMLWDTYMLPKDGWVDTHAIWLFLSFVFLIATGLIVHSIYAWLTKYTTVMDDNIQMRMLSNTDTFTGIFNKNYFNLCAKDEIMRSDRSENPISLLYFDLDHFKEINDTYGHARGDEVLLGVVDLVKQKLRANDIFARWGGDEFIILLPYTDLAGASVVAEKIQRAIEGMAMDGGERVTASIGIAERAHFEFWESWFRRTDEALYQAKVNGRNQYAVSNHQHNPRILKRIVWLQIWDCGVPEIDKAHRDLTVYCNELVMSSFDSSNIDETIRLAGQLLDETKHHFEMEIQYLREKAYPQVEAHAALHETLYQSTKKLYDGLIKHEYDSVELLNYLKDYVIIGHLVNADQHYRQYLH
ncbi:diguanylate cyclase [Fusibacter paucivorans]|uniref:Diguanylate cyclase n=1 Tax=Fusibacter paucivorans TaxID=76009 RepID=A0ABS5PQU1_9FIRM|nr:diguanylate cyclase [Fusibacter paucivorans]MBS7527433.1 diguanylate cyclase [Fusibacter paucivorans]